MWRENETAKPSRPVHEQQRSDSKDGVKQGRRDLRRHYMPGSVNQHQVSSGYVAPVDTRLHALRRDRRGGRQRRQCGLRAYCAAAGRRGMLAALARLPGVSDRHTLRTAKPTHGGGRQEQEHGNQQQPTGETACTCIHRHGCRRAGSHGSEYSGSARLRFRAKLL